VPGATVTLDPNWDKYWRGARLRVSYPGRHLGDLPPMVKPFVLLEAGSARVTPSVASGVMTSFVHDELLQLNQLVDYEDNRPRELRCVHPLVTLIDKLDALRRKVMDDALEPAAFARHFEDAAHIIRQEAQLPALPDFYNAVDLAHDMRDERDIADLPEATLTAFAPAATPRWDSIRRAHDAIAPMFWGPRISIDDACAQIRAWVAANFE
jgi:hypothetical protein